MIEYYPITDIGKKRESNQDCYKIIIDKYDNCFCVVCDGIGGANAGDVASKTVCDELEKLVLKNKAHRKLSDIQYDISNNIDKVNKKIYELALNNSEYYGMGTTLTGIYFSKHGAFTVNIGDSRVYGFKNNTLTQLTDDDSLVNELYKRGEITKDEMANHPNRNYLTKAIGIYKYVEPKINMLNDEYERYLICSDGLHGYVSLDEISNILSSSMPLKEMSQSLLKLALDKGGLDNITIVLCEKCQK